MSQAGISSLRITPPGTPIDSLTGNTGGPVGPDAMGNIDIPGAHGINTAGNPGTNTITIALDNTITLGDLASVIGSDAITLTTGDISLDAGNVNLPSTNAAGTEGVITIATSNFIHARGTGNTFVGANAGNLALTTGSAISNTGIGFISLQNITTGTFNIAIGSSALNDVTTGSNNTALGPSLALLTTGSDNIAIGFNAGNAYTTSESNNIVIGTTGTIADSATIRIGTGGTHTSTFVAGIDGVSVGNVVRVVTEASNQLGTADLTAGAGITITPTANTITIEASGSILMAYTNVDTTPYFVQPTDNFLGVDSSGGSRIIQLPDTTATGMTFTIKDRTGSANTNNITVTTVSGLVTIDGVISYIMDTQYAAIRVLFDGSTYQIF